MTPKSRKAKGHLFEKEIAKLIKEAYNFSSDDIRVTVGSENGADIKLSNRAKVKFPFSLELKRRAHFTTLYDFYEQAKKHDPKAVPAVVLRQDRSNPLIVLDFDHFLSLLGDKSIKINNKGE